MANVTGAPMLDETGQDIVSALQSIANKIGEDEVWTPVDDPTEYFEVESGVSFDALRCYTCGNKLMFMMAVKWTGGSVAIKKVLTFSRAPVDGMMFAGISYPGPNEIPVTLRHIYVKNERNDMYVYSTSSISGFTAGGIIYLA